MFIKILLVLLACLLCVCFSLENSSRPSEIRNASLKAKRPIAFRLKKREMRTREGTPAVRVKRSNASKAEEEDKEFEVVTEEDIQAADQAVKEELLKYAGWTLLAVVILVTTVVCFVMDPRTCLIAFGSGSPCCLLCPCYRHLMRYSDPAKLIKANVNLYVPGIYIERGGRMREYTPSPEEMDCLFDVIGEFITPE